MPQETPTDAPMTDRAELERFLFDFDRAWCIGSPPSLDDHVAKVLGGTAPPLHRELIEELVLIDLEHRWRAARTGLTPASPPLLEDYAARFPLLGTPREVTIRLIGEEFRIRHRFGDRPSQAEYVRRFPQQGAALLQSLREIEDSLVTECVDAGAAAPAGRPQLVQCSVHDLLGQIRQYQFLGSAQLNELLLAELRGTWADAPTLGEELLRRGWLTPFQVNLLVQGNGAELVLGPYVMLERLGEGGVGQVYKARHTRMKRIVALKLIRKELMTDPEVVSRFSREIQVVSQLSHIHVVRAYDAGQAGSTHYLVMEHVEGIDLSRLIKESGPLPLAPACDYVCQAALGLQHIHENGLVHRDIKPSNLLLDRRTVAEPAGGARPWGLIRILDLGLARLCRTSGAASVAAFDTDAPDTLTPAGAMMMGTPDYLAPEQALDFHRADHRADVYSLGCTFFYLLTGQPPFPGGTLAQKLLRHQQAPPPALEPLRPDVPAELAAIVRRMLGKLPEDRFARIAEVAQALAAVPLPTTGASPARVSLPIAIPISPMRSASSTTFEMTASRLLRPHRKPWLFVSGLVALVVALSALFWSLGTPAPRPPTEQASASPANPLDQLDAGTIPAEERRADQPRELVAVLGHHRGHHWGSVWDVAYSPDGQTLASGGYDGVVRLWDPATLAEKGVLQGNQNGVSAIMFSPGGRTIASGSVDGSVRLWDTEQRENRVNFQAHTGLVRALAFSPDFRWLATGGRDQANVRIWAVPKGTMKANLVRRQAPVYCVAFTPEGDLLCTWGRELCLYDPRKEKEIAVREHQNTINNLAFSRDAKMLATSSEDGTVKLWDMPGLREGKTLKHPSAVRGLAISPDGHLLVSGTQGAGPLRMWNARTGQLVGTTPNPIAGVASLAFSPDGKTVASVSLSQGLQLWDVARCRPRLPAEGHASGVFAARLLPDGRTLISAAGDGTLKLWDVLSGKELRSFDTGLTWEENYVMTQMALSPDGTRVVLGREVQGPCAPQVWDLSTGRQVQQFKAEHTDYIYSAAFSGDGKMLATGSRDGTVKLWDADTGTVRHTFKGHQTGGQHVAVALSPEGKLLAFVNAGPKPRLKVWDTVSGAVRFTGHHGGQHLYAVTFSPDGNWLATGGGGMIRLWDAKRGEQRATLTGHRKVVTSLCFSPDSQTLASSGTDGTVRLWEIPTGKSLQTSSLAEPSGWIGNISFSKDGRYLVTANGDGTIYILRLPR